MILARTRNKLPKIPSLRRPVRSITRPRLIEPRPTRQPARHPFATPSTASDLLSHEFKNPSFEAAQETPENILADLRARIQNKDALIPIQASLALTKSTGDTASAVLMRDFAVEAKGFTLLESRVEREEIVSRFRSYDRDLPALFWPSHFPVRVLTGTGVITSGKNVFLFFPEVLGLKAEEVGETFGFELIDVWRSMFEQTIFPCLPRVFDVQTQMLILSSLVPILDEVIYLASVFHEIGHRAGPFALTPKPKGPIRLTPFQWAIAGELSTDSLFSGLVQEVPELALFVLMQRIFAYGRRGFSDRPLTAGLNTDNDSWIASYLWSKARREKVIVPSPEETGRFRLNGQKLNDLFLNISQEIDQVGNHSEEAFDVWMKKWVATDSSGGYVLSSEFRSILHACSGVPEYPHFQTLLRR